MAGPNFDPYNLIGNIGSRAAQTRQQAGSLGDIAKKGDVARRLGLQKAEANTALEKLKGKQSIFTKAAEHRVLPIEMQQLFSDASRSELSGLNVSDMIRNQGAGYADFGKAGINPMPFSKPMNIQQLMKQGLSMMPGLTSGERAARAKPHTKVSEKASGVRKGEGGVGMEKYDKITTREISTPAKQLRIDNLRAQDSGLQVKEAPEKQFYTAPNGKTGTTLIVLPSMNQAFIVDDEGNLHAAAGGK
jgi:hypothetical protein